MGLFNLKDNKVIVDPNVLAIPEFKKLWDRDRSKEKDNATQELSYVYFMEDFQSPYGIVPEHLRETMVKEDFLKDKNYVIDDLVKEAMEKYRLLSETPTMRLVRSTRSLINRMSDYLKTAEVDGKTIKTLQDSVDKIAKTVAGYGKLEDAAKKEATGSSRTFGNKDIGDFER